MLVKTLQGDSEMLPLARKALARAPSVARHVHNGTKKAKGSMTRAEKLMALEVRPHFAAHSTLL